MRIDIKHFFNEDYPNKIEKTQKTWRFLGVVIVRKTYYYPKEKYYEIVNL